MVLLREEVGEGKGEKSRVQKGVRQTDAERLRGRKKVSDRHVEMGGLERDKQGDTGRKGGKQGRSGEWGRRQRLIVHSGVFLQ